jgi:hypothetical protein
MATTGYSDKLINRIQPSSSGQIEEVSTGCAVHDKNIVLSTAASTAIKNHGVCVINTTHVRVIEAPVKGCRKTVVLFNSTLAMKFRTAGATINNSTDDVVTCTFTSSTGTIKGVELNLYGYSTSQWYMGVGPTVSGAGGVTLKLSSST